MVTCPGRPIGRLSTPRQVDVGWNSPARFLFPEVLAKAAGVQYSIKIKSKTCTSGSRGCTSCRWSAFFTASRPRPRAVEVFSQRRLPACSPHVRMPSVRRWCLPCTSEAAATNSRDKRGEETRPVIRAGLARTVSRRADHGEPAQ